MLAAALTVGVFVVGLVSHLSSDGPAPIPGEGKRITGFMQVANRICTEHRANLRRAAREAHSRVQLLSSISRAIGWNVNDLESVSPPPTRADAFLAEVDARRHARTAILNLQRADELGDQAGRARAIRELDSAAEQAGEDSRAAGISQCAQVLPPMHTLVH